MLKSAWLLLLISVFATAAHAQVDTSKHETPAFTTSWFSASQFGTDSAIFINNNLPGAPDYIPKNTLGNSGLPLFPITLPALRQTGFTYFNNPYEWYFFRSEKLRFYNTRTPFTDLLYVTGSKIEQVFDGTFAVNPRPNWNIAANFFRIRSEGFYQRQNTNDNFIALSTNYRSSRHKYFVLGGIIYNNARNSENGGIADDSLLSDALGGDKKIVQVNLAAARRNNINRSVFLKQYFNLGRTGSDSTAIIPQSRFVLASSAEDNYLKYEDDFPLSGYYSNIYFDSLQTFDSAWFYKIDNRLSWERLDNKRHRGFTDKAGISAGVRHQLMRVRQREIDTVFQNVFAEARLYNTYSDHRLWWSIGGDYGLAGYNAGDYQLSAIFRKGFGDSLNLFSLSASVSAIEPDFIFQRYSSNHFRWMNDFEKNEVQRVMISFTSQRHRLDAGAEMLNYTRYTYFDNYAIARQYLGKIQVFKAWIKKNFTLFHWHLDNSVIGQLVPDSTVIRLPALVLNHALYYESSAFKKAMRLQVGFSVFYSTEYYGDRYMPATGQFYLQNEKLTGNYPVIDFFVQARIRQARVFLKIDHLNSGWMGDGYILSPGHPINDRAFKLGIAWKFFD